MDSPAYRLAPSSRELPRGLYYEELLVSPADRRRDERRRQEIRATLSGQFLGQAPSESEHRALQYELDLLDGRRLWRAFTLREIAAHARCPWRHHYRYARLLELRSSDAQAELERLLWAEADSLLLEFAEANPEPLDQECDRRAMEMLVDRRMEALGLGSWSWAVRAHADALLRHALHLRHSDAWLRLRAAQRKHVRERFMARGRDWVVEDQFHGRFLEEDGWRIILVIPDRFTGGDARSWVSEHARRQQDLAELLAVTLQIHDLGHPVVEALLVYTGLGITVPVAIPHSRYRHWLAEMRQIVGRIRQGTPTGAPPRHPDRCAGCEYRGACHLENDALDLAALAGRLTR